MIDVVQLQMLFLLFNSFGEENLKKDIWDYLKIYEPDLLVSAYRGMNRVTIVEEILSQLHSSGGELQERARITKVLKDTFDLTLMEAKYLMDSIVLLLDDNNEFPDAQYAINIRETLLKESGKLHFYNSERALDSIKAVYILRKEKEMTL